MKNYRNVISLVWTVVLLCCPKSEGACSDRDFTISMWNFVQCVENNYNSLMNDENDQFWQNSNICVDLEKRKGSCMSHIKHCIEDQKDFNQAENVLVEQWSHNIDLENHCRNFFGKIDIFSRRMLDQDVPTFDNGKCSHVLTFGNRKLFDRCKARVTTMLKRRMSDHMENKTLMMSDICRGVEDLVGCGERILSQCLEDDLVARMSETILINMEILLDSLEPRTGHNASSCNVFAERLETVVLDEDYTYLDFDETPISDRRSDGGSRVFSHKATHYLKQTGRNFSPNNGVNCLTVVAISAALPFLLS